MLIWYLIGVIFGLVFHVPHVGNDDDCFLSQNMVLNVGVSPHYNNTVLLPKFYFPLFVVTVEQSCQ